MKIIGLDIGATNTKFALIADDSIVEKGLMLTEAEKGVDYVIDKIAQLVEGFKDIESVAIGIPGIVDISRGIVRIPPNMPGWNNVPLREILEEKLNIPVYIVNDANLFALGEWIYGEGKGARDMIALTLGTGVGGGIIVKDKLLTGSEFSGGEVGHIVIDFDGPLCRCGNRGCLEAHIGAPYFVNMAKKSLKVKGEITPEDITQYARRGDKSAIELWQKFGFYLGIGLVSLVHLFSPEVIIIGGGLSSAWDLWIDNTRATIHKRVMGCEERSILLKKSNLQEDASFYGAVYLVKRKGNV